MNLSIPTRRRRFARPTGSNLARSSSPNSSHNSSPNSSWFRLLALLCVFLVGIGSTAQACHSHDNLPTSSKTSPNRAPQSAPDHCPLCVAMHSALPSSAQGEPVRVQSVQAVLPPATRPHASQHSVFDLFSRPPPALSPRAIADGSRAEPNRSMHSPEV